MKKIKKNLEIFKKKIGFDFNIESNPPTFSIDINKYSNKNNCSGNFLQTFSVIEQIKIIETYITLDSHTTRKLRT
jgi:hypothetical protein